MAKTYTIEEKQEAIIEYNKSGTTISEYSRDKGIPETTFRDWINKFQTNDLEGFGLINIGTTKNSKVAITKTIVNFNTDKIRIELKEGYNKKLLKYIVKAVLKC